MGAGSQELTERAKLLISERRYQEAVRACRRALLSKPDQVELRLLLGEALLALERYDEVRVEMMALARKAPDNAAVHRLLGEAYLRDHRPNQAVEALRRALQLDPNDEVAEELLNEAADENAPVSTTIERWFADEAEPTVETPSPSGWEEPTAQPGATAPQGNLGPNIEVDPTLTEPLVTEPRTNPSQLTPEMRPPVAPPPEPPSLGMALDVAPPIAPLRGDTSNDVVVPPGQPSPFAVPPIEPASPPPEDLTSAARPSVKRLLDAGDPMDDYELLASDEVEELENEPTRALVSDMPLAPRIRELEDDYDELPTNAIDIKDLEAEATRAHIANEAPTRAAPAGRPLPEPPTRAHISTAGLERREAAATAPPIDQPPTVGYETPAVPNEAIEAPNKQVETERVRPKRTSWLVPAIVGGLLVLGLLGGIGYALTRYLAAADVEELRQAAADAGDTGMRGDLEAVVERIGDTETPELRALKVRLLATLTLEHGEDHTAEIDAIVASLPSDEQFNDAHIGRAFVALSQEDPDAALQALSGLEVEDDQIPEAFRARALALAAQGSWSLAAEAAQRAFEVRSTSPRHLALHALMRHRTSNTAGARTLLEGYDGAATQPSIRLTLARVLLESGADPERAVDEARAVVGELSRTATPYQLAWAHLILAHHAAESGNVGSAAEAAREASEHRPPSDELFAMRLVETFLKAGYAEAADEQLAHLPSPAVDRAGRALLTAKVALALGDLDRADAAIHDAGDGVRQSLIRARILEERGDLERARPLYETAMESAGPEGRRARVRLAAIEFAAGNPRNTIRYLEEHQTEAVDDPDLIPLLARAYLAEGRPEDARPILETALSRRPTAPELLAAQGELLLAEGEPAEALEPLRRAARLHAHDAEIQANLGQAAFLTGEIDEARTAWEAALEHDAEHAQALVGLARLAMRAREYDEVETRLAAAEQTEDEALAVAQMRGELRVRRGDGWAGVEPVLELTRRFPDDASIWTALGQLQAQAESDRDAARSFERALRIDPNRPDTLLARSLIEMRRGDLSSARRSVTTAVSQMEQRGMRTNRLLAQAKIARARVEFEEGDWPTVRRLATEAIQLDEHASGAHLLLAIMAIEGRGETEPVTHLRAAVAGDAPAPEALAQLLTRLPSSERAEACRLAQRYMAVAPSGYDASEVRRVDARCR